MAAGMTSIIDDLYAGTLDPTAWRRAIIAISDRVSGAAAFIFCVNPSTATILRDEAYRADPVEYQKYQQHWVAKDIRIGPGMGSEVGEPVFEGRLMSVKRWQASEIYNDYLYPNDSPWYLAFLLHKSPDKVVNFSINGSRRRGAFDARDGERIRPLISHLRRALEIKDRIETTQIRCDALGSSLDSMNFGVIILDASAKALELSGSAREILGDGSGISLHGDGTLSLREPAGSAFRQWVRRGYPAARQSAGLIHLPRPLRLPISLMITRLPEIATSWIGGGPPAWLLLVFDPDRQIGMSTDVIARDLGISAREAEVAAHLAAGYDPCKIARRLHISIHTVRSHLKAIFAKTGLASQVELVARIAKGPSIRSGRFRS